jgi:UrcA family protein
MTTQHRRVSLSLVIGAATALAGVGPTLAAPSASQVQVVSEVVRYADLDPNTEAGARRLALRIRLAADRVCSQIYMQGSDDLAPCHKAAIDGAVAELDAPLVKAALGVSPRSDLANAEQ